MGDAFDGAGKPFRGPTFRAALVLALMILLVLAVLWLAGSWALKEADKQGINTNTNEQPLGSP